MEVYKNTLKEISFQRVIQLFSFGVLCWVAVDYPDYLLGWTCFVIWMLAEYKTLPPVIAAFERGSLETGENAVPWAQNFLASASRVAYFYHPQNNLRVDLLLGCFFAMCINSYTGLVAVNVAKGKERTTLMAMVWFGIFASAVIQLEGGIEVAGFFFVGICSTNRFGLLAGIPHAWSNRDGRFFCDFQMVLYQLVCCILWTSYAVQISNFYLFVNMSLGTLCCIPPLIVKGLLHPKLFGNPDLYVDKQVEDNETDSRSDIESRSVYDDEAQNGEIGMSKGVELTSTVAKVRGSKTDYYSTSDYFLNKSSVFPIDQKPMTKMRRQISIDKDPFVDVESGSISSEESKDGSTYQNHDIDEETMNRYQRLASQMSSNGDSNEPLMLSTPTKNDNRVRVTSDLFQRPYTLSPPPKDSPVKRPIESHEHIPNSTTILDPATSEKIEHLASQLKVDGDSQEALLDSNAADNASSHHGQLPVNFFSPPHSMDDQNATEEDMVSLSGTTIFDLPTHAVATPKANTVALSGGSTHILKDISRKPERRVEMKLEKDTIEMYEKLALDQISSSASSTTSPAQLSPSRHSNCDLEDHLNMNSSEQSPSAKDTKKDLFKNSLRVSIPTSASKSAATTLTSSNAGNNEVSSPTLSDGTRHSNSEKSTPRSPVYHDDQSDEESPSHNDWVSDGRSKENFHHHDKDIQNQLNLLDKATREKLEMMSEQMNTDGSSQQALLPKQEEKNSFTSLSSLFFDS